jgi:hypothetical protein
MSWLQAAEYNMITNKQNLSAPNGAEEPDNSGANYLEFAVAKIF